MRAYKETSKADFLAMARETCDKALTILGAKNDDYSTRDLQGDGLHNFRLIETYELATAEVGVFVRLSDKMTRIANFLKTGLLSVEDEKIDDTIIDAINYLIILRSVIKSYKNASDPTAVRVPSVSDGWNISHFEAPEKDCWVLKVCRFDGDIKRGAKTHLSPEYNKKLLSDVKLLNKMISYLISNSRVYGEMQPVPLLDGGGMYDQEEAEV